MELLLPEDATKEDFARLRAELGLDKPIPVQYLIFMKEALRGELWSVYPVDEIGIGACTRSDAGDV